jgi:predicted hydrocarbon binding protein
LASGREFYEIDDDRGVIVSKVLSERAFMLGLEAWTFLVKRLTEKFGSATQVIFYEMGRSYGQSVSLRESSSAVDSSQRIKYLTRKAMIAGWGKVSVSTISDSEINVRVDDCVFCAGIADPKLKEVPCYFLRGFISSLADSIYGTNKTVETKCSKEYCEFNVKFE